MWQKSDFWSKNASIIIKKRVYLSSGNINVYYMGTWSDSGSLWLLLSIRLRLDRPFCSIELECAPGANWWLLKPLLGPSGRLRGMGNFGCEATPWVKLLGNKFRFRVFGRISSFWKSQRLALAGTGFGAQLLLMSNLRQICFSVTFVSSALEAWLPWEFELKVSSYGFCFNRQPIVSVHLSIDSCVGLVTTWLILPVVICLSQRLSHACLSISFCTAKLRMAH